MEPTTVGLGAAVMAAICLYIGYRYGIAKTKKKHGIK